MFYEGDGVKVNKNKAAEYFKQAQYYGHGESMFRYAQMLHFGDGIKMNKNEASNYYRQASQKE